jgi:AmmeMemoRadiSam system protein A
MTPADAHERLGAATRAYLLASARRSLADVLGVKGHAVPSRPPDPRLSAPARVFVSWHLSERLVGCIGTLQPWPTLEDAVSRYAVEAGINDPRTHPAQPHELGHLQCEISVLGEPRPLPEIGISKIERVIVPQRDGVIVSLERLRAVFLPVVWHKLPHPRTFLEALCRKAGIESAADKKRVRAQVFTTDVFEDSPLSH